MKEKEDKILYRKIARGNKLAFDTLFRKYYSQLVKFAIGYTHDGQAAEEIVQDVFVRLWENADRHTIESSVLAYLYSSVRNQALNEIKHREVVRKHENEKAKTEAVVTTEADPGIDLKRFGELLRTAIGTLPEKCRNIFELSKFEGLTYDEIADYLQVSSKTVENQMGIALKKLREVLVPHQKEILYK